MQIGWFYVLPDTSVVQLHSESALATLVAPLLVDDLPFVEVKSTMRWSFVFNEFTRQSLNMLVITL
jgi:hypothetical protein